MQPRQVIQHKAQALAEGGAWIKLSGWYRLGAVAPYRALAPNLERARALFGRRCVWGSDWPHTSFAPDALPRYATLLAPVCATAQGAARAVALRHSAAALYGGFAAP
jgi:predicted TIM-barrel fold metal-dependent hydrolase